MHETNSLSVQQEIQSNMTVVSGQDQSCNNNEPQEQPHTGTHVWGNSRASRKVGNNDGTTTTPTTTNNNLNKHDQARSVNLPNCENILNIRHNAEVTRTTQNWLESVNRRVKSAEGQHCNYSSSSSNNSSSSSNNSSNKGSSSNNSSSSNINNRSCSENLDTVKENLRNSQESIKRTNTVNIMDLEQNMRDSTQPRDASVDSLCSKSLSSASLASMARSTDELDSSYPRGTQVKDPHTAAIDLSNNCRQFYFSHMKTAESIKQSIRSARHTRAREKMEGKQPSRLENAMHRLKTEMAELMDQDLSLMSQLLKLNDKIEDIKTQVSSRYRQNSLDSSCSSFGSTDISDSDFSDYEDSRVDLTKSVNSPHGYVSTARRLAGESSEVQLRRIEESKKDIIVYRKRPVITKKAKKVKSSSETDEDTAKEDNDEDDDDDEDVFSSDEDNEPELQKHRESDDGDGDDGSNSDSGSTISNNSRASNNDDDADDDSKTKRKNSNGLFQSPLSLSPEVPAKPVKGGVSRNTNFLDFHKNNGNVRSAGGLNQLLGHQGHNVSVEKYFVPQSLVYLKHTKDENVFCQFQH